MTARPHRQITRAGLLAWACVQAGCGSTNTAGATGPVVTDIEIVGAEAISPDDLKERLATQETGWWPFARKHRFDPAQWQVDLERIDRYYEAQGHYRAEVRRAEVIDQGAGRVALRVEVEENEPLRIADITLRGLESLPVQQRQDMLDDLPLRPGEVFLERRWQEGKGRIIERLQDAGRAAAALVGEAKLDLKSNRGDLDLLVDPGRRYRFGDILVSMPEGGIVDPALVREQVQLALEPDRGYGEAKLEEAQRRVFGMGVFASARVSAGEPDPGSGLVPVVVDVRPAPFHTVRLGGGVAIDQVRQEARLLASWGDRNFLGGLRKLGLEALAGWAFIPSTLAVVRNRVEDAPRQGPIFRATGELEQPRLFARPTLKLKGLLEAERTIEPTYDALGGRTRLGVTWQPRSSTVVLGSYNLQGYRLAGPAAISASTAPLALGCTDDPCFVLLSYLEQVASWDRRDHPLEPRRGFFLSLSLQQGGGPLGGDFEYLRLLPEARAYVTSDDGRPWTLAMRLRFGTLATRTGRPEDSPVVARFFAGGPNSMRGFGLRRLSPMLLVPVDPGRSEVRVPLPVGGNGLIEGSFELRTPLRQQLLLAAFTDFGTVTRERLPLREAGRLLWAVGLGLRYLSPIGPIRVDLGVRLPFGRPPPLYDLDGTEITYRRLPGGATEPGRENGDNIAESCFGIGGSGGSSWVSGDLCSLHISIGEAF
jgi:translocation and assembly module TamA